MTGCLYVNPGIPALMADTIVSTRDGNLPPIRPSNITSSTVLNYKSVAMARKLYLITNNIAVACSGDESTIREFLYTLYGIGDCIESEDRPMKIISNLANDYSSTLRYIGAFNRGGIVNVGGPTADMFDTNFFNQCSSIGSGKIDLKQYLLEVDGRSDILPDDPYSRLSIAHKVINIRRLAEESAGSYGTDHGWGGYVEMAFHDGIMWNYCESELNLSIAYNEKSEKYEICGRVYAYDPKKIHGAVGVFWKEDVIYNANWMLYDVTKDYLDIDYGDHPWDGWFPSKITIMIYSKDGVGNKFVCLSDEYAKMVTLDFSKGNFELVIPPEIISEFTESFTGLRASE